MPSPGVSSSLASCHSPDQAWVPFVVVVVDDVEVVADGLDDRFGWRLASRLGTDPGGGIRVDAIDSLQDLESCQLRCAEICASGADDPQLVGHDAADALDERLGGFHAIGLDDVAGAGGRADWVDLPQASTAYEQSSHQEGQRQGDQIERSSV